MKQIFFVLTLYLLIFTASGFSDDILYTVDGDEFKGILLSIDTDSLKFKLPEGIKIYNKKKINKIKISYQETQKTKQTLDDIEDTFINNIFETYKNYDTKTVDYSVLYIEKIYDFSNFDNPKIKIRKIIKIHTDEGKSASANIINFHIKNEKVHIDWGRTINPNKNIFSLSQSGIEKADLLPQLSEYNFLKELKFVLKNVTVGSILDFCYTINYNKIDFLNNFYSTEFFQSNVPVKEKIVKIIYPKNHKLIYEIINDKKGNIKKIVEKNNTIKNITFKIKNPAPIKKELFVPNPADYIPNVTFCFKYKWKNLKNIVKNKNLVNKKIISNLDVIKNIHLTNIFENLKYLYYYIAKEIRFVNVPIDILNYEHLPISKINNIKYANQYDKNFLFYSILKYLNYNVDLLLCKQNSQGNFNQKIPSLSQFNSVLVKVKLDNKTYYLNPINENIPFGYISNNYQNIKVLNLTNDKILFEKIPLLPIENELSKITLNITLNTNGDLSGKGIINFFGGMGIGLKNYKYMNKEQRKKNIESYINRLFNKSVKVHKYIIKYLEDKNNYPEITFDFDIKDYAQIIGNKFLLFKMPLVYFDSSKVSEENRFYPLYFGKRQKDILNINLELPKQYQVSYNPDLINLNKKYNTFQNNITINKNKISYSHTETSSTIKCSKDYYSDYKNFNDTLSRYSQEWWVFKK